jgi:UDP-glucose 4-epimerase
MRALVTGGAGFIGSHLVDRLIVEGWRVAVVDNLSTGQHRHLNRKAAFYEADITSARLATVFRQARPEVVFHLAAQTSVIRSIQRPDRDARANVLGTINVVQACLISGVQRLVLTSTGGALYGEPERLPCAEDHPIRPLSPYGASKYAAEIFTATLAGLGGLRHTVLRYGNVYGPRQDPMGEAGVIAIFSRRMLRGEDVTIFGDGGQERDFVYVDDVVEANLCALQQQANDTFNIGTGIGASVNTVAQQLAKLTRYRKRPQHAPARPGEVYRIYLDIAKARHKLRWSPRVGLNEGLRRTVAYFRKSR